MCQTARRGAGDTHDASESNAATEKESNPQITESSITNQTALTGVWVYWLTRFHHREPGSASSLEKANTTLDASTV